MYIILNISVVKFAIKMIRIFIKTHKICTATVNSKPTLVHKSSRMKAHNASAVPIVVYGSARWTSDKRTQNSWYQSRWNCSEEQPGAHFLAVEEMKKLWKSWN